MGAPQPIYNGGLLHARLRYFDVKRQRPGLPEDVAALVDTIEANRTVVRIVNLSPTDERELLLQAGAFGEHRFTSATYKHRTSTWPGELGGYAGTYSAPQMKTEQRTVDLPNGHCSVELPPGTEIRLDLATERHVNKPSYSTPI